VADAKSLVIARAGDASGEQECECDVLRYRGYNYSARVWQMLSRRFNAEHLVPCRREIIGKIISRSFGFTPLAPGREN
jgi:hypothetical protein